MNGPFDAITDVSGVLVGHHPGTTVVLVPGAATAAVDERGPAPISREVDLLEPENLVGHVWGVCLCAGGPAGLAAADGVLTWLSERELGFPVGSRPHEVVPIVPAAACHGGGAPDAASGYAACDAAVAGPVAPGRVGAAALETASPGGVGTASEVLEGFTVGALAVVRACEVPAEPGRRPGVPSGGSATIGVVAVDAALTKADCRRLAIAGQDGLARAVVPRAPSGTVVFAMATGDRPLPPPGDLARPGVLDDLCAAAARVFTRAVRSGAGS